MTTLGPAHREYKMQALVLTKLFDITVNDFGAKKSDR